MFAGFWVFVFPVLRGCACLCGVVLVSWCNAVEGFGLLFRF